MDTSSGAADTTLETSHKEKKKKKKRKVEGEAQSDGVDLNIVKQETAEGAENEEVVSFIKVNIVIRSINTF